MRTFIAIEISAEIRRELEGFQQKMRKIEYGCKWVVPENMHLTIHFLGEIEDSYIQSAADVISSEVKDRKPFVITLQGSGVFPNWKRPRVIWAGVSRGKEKLLSIHKGLQEKLETLGMETDNKRFSPHVTLGRVRNLQNYDSMKKMLEENADKYWGIQTVQEVHLMGSQLYPSGPVYNVLKRIPFCG